MLITTKGIILRSKKYGETSVIADIYTSEKGLGSYIISGVRKKKSTVSQGLIQVMSLIEMVAYDRPNNSKKINRIKEIKSAYLYQDLFFDVHKSAVGMFMAELAAKTIKEPEKNEDLFNFLFHSFQYLDQCTVSIAKLHLSFMVKLSYFLGFHPEENYNAEKPYFDLREGKFVRFSAAHQYHLNNELSEYFAKLLTTKLTQSHLLEIPKQSRNELLEYLLIFYKFHVPNFPTINAHLILKEVLS